ncbi:M48 family metalloprotease [Sulfuracidifex metallicus]|uniref:M48 family metalloprotease n=1 Tax=Sulfuracidifex metallicus DSM 6482 = JCM 9184 TaxID=523847 RepID=A0A6A9QNW4_SULME|nr:M48 family metalloprotease [Sulfuracidifex metallicus]MUN28871.1 M48 family metalloprotease [Sulfuracidifex metallicus DSM 6482 = JCM 9184]WOE50618.1 M48 family metalloprotease [Sulfuracidifex metallicus DSM 6482 = JCM 9184]
MNYFELISIALAFILLLPFTLVPWMLKKKSYPIDYYHDQIRVLKGYSQINAFSVRGIRSHLILISESTLNLDYNELQAIIAHEEGHIKLNHHVKMTLVMGIPIYTSLLLIIKGEVFFAIPILLITLLAQKVISRRFELEADRYALKTTSRDELASVISRYGERRSSLISTHPDVSTRLKNIGYS